MGSLIDGGARKGIELTIRLSRRGGRGFRSERGGNRSGARARGNCPVLGERTIWSAGNLGWALRCVKKTCGRTALRRWREKQD
eukprot:6211067-Pleurochrysis_carterae.AAC.2